MSLLRPALRTAVRRAPTQTQARALSSSAPRRGGHSDHAASSEADTHETFFNATWRNTFILMAAGALLYEYLPSPKEGSASPSVSNDALAADAKDDKVPWLTRVIASEMAGKADTWAERNSKHLELAAEVADTKLIFQEAERPKVWRMRNPSSFEAASPHKVAVGSQADLSDLKIKSDD